MALFAIVLCSVAPELAVAQAGEVTPPSFGTKMVQLVPMFAIVMLVFYLIVIGPQNKRLKDQDKLLGELKKGDAVVTNSGIYGKVFAVAIDHFLLEVAPNVRIKCERTAIARKEKES